MAGAKEKELDQAFEDALKGSRPFADWFLAQTRFGKHRGQLAWCRSNYVWGAVPVPHFNPVTGETETVIRESETDILAVYELEDSTRVGIHIENKVGLGKFTPNQPDFYEPRAKAWVGLKRYGNYSQWTTVLIAPQAFRNRSALECAKFQTFIPHESIGFYIPLFCQAGLPEALPAIRTQFDLLIQEVLLEYPNAEAARAPENLEHLIGAQQPAYLPVAGMYGGFNYWLEWSGSEIQLIVESWSRVVEGSGQRHSIRVGAVSLLDQGFV